VKIKQFAHHISNHALKKGINWRAKETKPEAKEDDDLAKTSVVAGYAGGGAGSTGVSALAKGQNGDWEKEGGYKIHHFPSTAANGSPFHEYYITHDSVGHSDPQNKHIASFSFSPDYDSNGTKKDWVATSWVDPKHQRKGLASHTYRMAEKKHGMKLVSDQSQSEDAKALWANPDRKFGKSETVDKIQKSLTKIKDLLKS